MSNDLRPENIEDRIIRLQNTVEDLALEVTRLREHSQELLKKLDDTDARVRREKISAIRHCIEIHVRDRANAVGDSHARRGWSLNMRRSIAACMMLVHALQCAVLCDSARSFSLFLCALACGMWFARLIQDFCS